MNDESRSFLYDALIHVSFLQDLLQETGKVKELDRTGWWYGTDWNGGDSIIDQQFGAVMSVLGKGIQASCSTFYVDYEENLEEQYEKWDESPLTFEDFGDSELWVQNEMVGEPDEIRKWACFIQWLRPNALLIRDKEQGDKKLIWYVNYEIGVVQDEWRVLITAWKVMEFYDHIADAASWRERRDGLCEAPDTTEQATAVGDQGELKGSLQDGRMDTIAGIARSLHDRRSNQENRHHRNALATTA